MVPVDVQLPAQFTSYPRLSTRRLTARGFDDDPKLARPQQGVLLAQQSADDLELADEFASLLHRVCER
jgi:hypothetical protein